jgi:DDE superfamily endonuclease
VSFSHLPLALRSAFLELAHWLHKRSAARLPLLLAGILFAKGRRTVTSWFRAAGIADDHRQGYVTVCAVGRAADSMALTVLAAIRPLLDPRRLLLAIDDTPTPRYGPCVEGCGVHHNPSPGPAGERHVYGHVWVVLAALARHPLWDTIALPARQLRWLLPWVEGHFERRWVAVDGGYAKKPFLRPAQQDGWVVVSRLRKDAHLCELPPAERRPGQRGPMPTYGKGRISLARRAGHRGGWQQVECVQYGAAVTKTVKSFLATWRPAGGVIRVVLVKEPDGWVAFFCTDPRASAAEVLEAMADRGAIEQTNKDVKEVWGAGQQQVRNLDSSVGCFNLNLWLYSLVEAWAWHKVEEGLVDRSAAPWDSEPRRPSHADKRKALRRGVLRAEIEGALSGRPTKGGMRALAGRLLDLAA